MKRCLVRDLIERFQKQSKVPNFKREEPRNLLRTTAMPSHRNGNVYSTERLHRAFLNGTDFDLSLCLLDEAKGVNTSEELFDCEACRKKIL